MGTKTKTKNSTKLFFSGVIVLTISNLIIKAIGLLFKIPMHNYLSGLGMGYYNTAYIIYTVLYMISTAGLPVATSILISENRSLGKIDQVKKVFRVALGLFFFVGLFGMALMMGGAHWFSLHVIKSEATTLCILAVAPTLFFICLTSALRGYFQGYQHMVPVAVSQLIEALCKLFLGIAFALYARQKYGTDVGALKYVAAYAILGITIGAGLGMIFLTFTKLLFKSEKYDAEYLEESGENHETTPAKTILKRIVIIALPITISSSVMSLTSFIDSILIQNLLQTFKGMSENLATTIYGNYTTLAVPMFNLPPVLVYPISYSIVPLITAARTKGDHERAHRIMESALRVTVLIGLPCAIGLAALSEPILSLFYRERAAIVSTAPLLSILAPSTFFLCVLSVTNAMLQACGHERKPVISMLLGAVAKIAANVALLYFIGMPGTPISTFICYLTATVINMVFITKYTDLKLNVKRVFVRPFIAGIICGVAAVGSRLLFVRFLPGKISTILAILSAILVYVSLIFSVKAIESEDISLLPKGEKIAGVIKRVRLNTVASTVIICLLIGAVGGAGFGLSASKYKKIMARATSAESAEAKISEYAAAAKTRPLSKDPYYGMISAMKEDGVLSDKEEVTLGRRLSYSLADLSKEKFYPDLAMKVAELYLSSYVTDTGGTEKENRENRVHYLSKVSQWADNSAPDGSGYPHGDLAAGIRDVADHLLDDMKKDDKTDDNGKGNEKVTPEETEKAESESVEYFKAIKRLAKNVPVEKDLDALVGACGLAAEALDGNLDRFIDAGVKAEDIDKTLDRLINTLERTSPSSVCDRNKEAMAQYLTTLNAIKIKLEG
ncbi:MAG: polysaccharide biosynthesis protein [Clostridia bacterium]|nr:polysaccharide biosynthesis protein [Clostridia bacterium]